jgi:hypothetical protein
MNVLNPSIPYTILTQFNTIATNYYHTIACCLIGKDYGIRLTPNITNITNVPLIGDTTSGTTNDWFSNQSGTTYSYINGVPTDAIITGNTFTTMGLSVSSVDTTTTTLGSTTFPRYSIGVIGTDGYSSAGATGRGMIGYMSEFIMYNTPLQPTDLVNYNTSRLQFLPAYQTPANINGCY